VSADAREASVDRVRQSLRELVNGGTSIVMAGAGTGLSARASEAGGADLIVIYNSGRFRMAGRGSLAGMMPFGDANQIVLEMANEIVPVVKRAPVVAGVCGTDPFRQMPRFLDELRALGIVGVINYPTVGLIDGRFRLGLEETGMGFNREVELIRIAAAMGFLTTPYVFNPDEARLMAEAGADVVVAHMGLTTSGDIGARTAVSLDDCVTAIGAIGAAAREVRDDVIVLCHGGPLADPDDYGYVLDRVPGLNGFVGASSIERLATERALPEVVTRFKQRVPKAPGDARRQP
jgi:predicted TIM-barrel enzyme